MHKITHHRETDYVFCHTKYSQAHTDYNRDKVHRQAIHKVCNNYTTVKIFRHLLRHNLDSVHIDLNTLDKECIAGYHNKNRS